MNSKMNELARSQPALGLAVKNVTSNIRGSGVKSRLMHDPGDTQPCKLNIK